MEARIIPDYVRGQIYCIKCNGNPKEYIGMTKTHQWRSKAKAWIPYGYQKRYAQHLINAKGVKNSKKCRALYAAINAHKPENFEVVLLEECSIDLLDEAETRHIRERNTIAPNGYNLESGGNKNKFASTETRAKQSESRKKYNETVGGKLFKEKHKVELAKFNSSNNDNKKVDRYATRVVNRLRVVNCAADSHIYIYIYCDGLPKRNKIRFRYDTVTDPIKIRVRTVVERLKQPNTVVEIEDNTI